jgi:hypothetical protein
MTGRMDEKLHFIPTSFNIQNVLTLTPLPPRRTTGRTDTENIIYKDKDKVDIKHVSLVEVFVNCHDEKWPQTLTNSHPI